MNTTNFLRKIQQSIYLQDKIFKLDENRKLFHEGKLVDVQNFTDYQTYKKST